MADRRPLVIIGGQLQELPLGDGIVGASISGAMQYMEPLVISGHNTDVVYDTGVALVPMLLTTIGGDIITAVVPQ